MTAGGEGGDESLLACRALDSMSPEVALLDGKGVVTFANRAWRRSAGMPVGEAFQDVCGSCGDHDLDALVLQSLERVLIGRSPHVELEVPLDGPDGQRWKLLLFEALDGGGAVVTRVDVTRSRDVLDLVSESALHDALTGLPNRSLLEDRIATAVARTERGHSAPAVLFMDLDRFKAVNDELGHEAGDRVLAAVGRRLNSSLRAADSCGRWGGDEFVALVEVLDGDGGEAITGVIERICDTLNAPIELDGQPLDIGVSVGAVLVRPGDSPNELVALADAAMYDAKRAGLQAAVAERDVIDLRLRPRPSA